MEAFEQYLLSEYQLPQNVVCNKFNYSHSSKNKVDKKSNRPITNHIINVKIESFDDKHNLISSHSEKFIDGNIYRTKQNKLINISPAELNNKFSFAKSSIINVIKSEYQNKLNDIQEKIKELDTYCRVDGVIPTQFVNEPTISTDQPTNQPTKNKHFEF